MFLQALKHLMRLDENNPDAHRCLVWFQLFLKCNICTRYSFYFIFKFCFISPVMQIKFFHKVSSMPAPVTDAEKLIWGVIQAERPAFRCCWKKFPFSSFFPVLSPLLSRGRGWGGGSDFDFSFYSIWFVPCFYTTPFCSQLHDKSLTEANSIFLEKHRGNAFCMVYTGVDLHISCYSLVTSVSSFQIPWGTELL